MIGLADEIIKMKDSIYIVVKCWVEKNREKSIEEFDEFDRVFEEAVSVANSVFGVVVLCSIVYAFVNYCSSRHVLDRETTLAVIGVCNKCLEAFDEVCNSIGRMRIAI